MRGMPPELQVESPNPLEPETRTASEKYHAENSGRTSRVHTPR